MLNRNTGEQKGFTLIELAVVMVLMGIIMSVTVKWLPSLLREYGSTKREAEFKQATKSKINTLLTNGKSGFLPSVSRLSPYPQLDNFTDGQNKPWGYLPAYDTTKPAGKSVCNHIMQGSITLRYCMDKKCADYKDQTDIALLFFTNSPEFLSSITYGGYGVNAIKAENYNSSPLILYLEMSKDGQYQEIENIRAYHNSITAYTYTELRDIIGCPGIKAAIPGYIDMPTAYAGEPYSYSGMNFAAANGVMYCFTENQPKTGLTINNNPFSGKCTESAVWTEDKNHSNLWVLSGTAPKQAGILYFTGHAKISSDDYITETKFALPVSVR
ncbi:MAG: type II secretion system GspH family protein [Deferribacteraceae bacterium]|jgi:prepilin-type N-terminal cleavage/methylation domain-containing protein|nr:type II secretion system GspH family protein [Deferribacteraceae bacterium]